MRRARPRVAEGCSPEPQDAPRGCGRRGCRARTCSNSTSGSTNPRDTSASWSSLDATARIASMACIIVSCDFVSTFSTFLDFFVVPPAVDALSAAAASMRFFAASAFFFSARTRAAAFSSRSLAASAESSCENEATMAAKSLPRGVGRLPRGVGPSAAFEESAGRLSLGGAAAVAGAAGAGADDEASAASTREMKSVESVEGAAAVAGVAAVSSGGKAVATRGCFDGTWPDGFSRRAAWEVPGLALGAPRGEAARAPVPAGFTPPGADAGRERGEGAGGAMLSPNLLPAFWGRPFRVHVPLPHEPGKRTRAQTRGTGTRGTGTSLKGHPACPTCYTSDPAS